MYHKYRYISAATGAVGHANTSYEAVIDALGYDQAQAEIARMEDQTPFSLDPELLVDVAHIYDSEGNLVGRIYKL